MQGSLRPNNLMHVRSILWFEEGPELGDVHALVDEIAWLVPVSLVPDTDLIAELIRDEFERMDA